MKIANYLILAAILLAAAILIPQAVIGYSREKIEDTISGAPEFYIDDDFTQSDGSVTLDVNADLGQASVKGFIVVGSAPDGGTAKAGSVKIWFWMSGMSDFDNTEYAVLDDGESLSLDGLDIQKIKLQIHDTTAARYRVGVWSRQ